MKNPSHPGEVIKIGVIEPLDLSVSKAAEILGVRRATLSALLNGKASLSAEMALRIEKAFGPKLEHMLRVQAAYDAAQQRLKENQIEVERYAVE